MVELDGWKKSRLLLLTIPSPPPPLHFLPSILKQVFHDLVLHSSSQQSKQLRNDVLTICSLVTQQCPNAPFVVG